MNYDTWKSTDKAAEEADRRPTGDHHRDHMDGFHDAVYVDACDDCYQWECELKYSGGDLDER